jgi:hypothetical protein
MVTKIAVTLAAIFVLKKMFRMQSAKGNEMPIKS